tara:strand:+ start:2078 stop:2476 length:399 start_codon:yes stop_codon:yes gene_type:complete
MTEDTRTFTYAGYCPHDAMQDYGGMGFFLRSLVGANGEYEPKRNYLTLDDGTRYYTMDGLYEEFIEVLDSCGWADLDRDDDMVKHFGYEYSNSISAREGRYPAGVFQMKVRWEDVIKWMGATVRITDENNQV